MAQDARELAQSLLDTLNARIDSVEDLVANLEPVLQCYGLLAAVAGTKQGLWSELDDEQKRYILRTSFADIQRVLASKIVVDWLGQLQRANGGLHETIWKPFFCPSRSSPYATAIALSSYSVLTRIISNKPGDAAGLSSVETVKAPLHPLVQQTALSTLADLSTSFNIHHMYRPVLGSTPNSRTLLDWQAFVNLYLSIPTRVANLSVSEGHQQEYPVLEWRNFFLRLSRDVETLLGQPLSSSEIDIQALAYLIGKLVKSGFMVSSPTQTSFWPSIWGPFRRRLLSPCYDPQIGQTWQKTLSQLTSADLATFSVTSLAHMQVASSNGQKEEPSAVKQHAMLCFRMFGELEPENGHIWDIVVERTLLGRQNWGEEIARVLVTWTALSSSNGQDALSRLLEQVSVLWVEKSVIEQGGVSYHAFLTTIFALVVNALPARHPSIIALSQSSSFITSISAHLSSLRPSIRFSGMYIAELVSQTSLDPEGPVKALDFAEIWEEEGEGQEVVRRLRELLALPKDWKPEDWEIEDDVKLGEVEELDKHSSAPAPVRQARNIPPANQPTAKGASKIQVMSSSTSDYEEYDDNGEDEDLQPYAMPAPPPAEDLKDLEDPSAYTPNKKKVKPPVYIADLSALLKSTQDPEKIEVGLKEAEGLIRRKAGWGTELQDNAVDLSFTLTGLQDNYSLKDFEELRRNALTALMVSAPVKAAPAVIEQYFSNQYSISQKFAMLSSLALGARELAGLPSLLPPAQQPQIDPSFPTQRLPPKLHQHFISAQMDERPVALPSTTELDAITDSITNVALSQARESGEQSIPEAGREKMLTVRTTKKVLSAAQKSSHSAVASGDVNKPKFASLAVETFVMPLINRFWLYLRDFATSPQNSSSGPYAGGRAGTATLLDPLLLSKYLATLSVLLDAAKNSPHFLAVLAPETLELVLSLRGADNGDQAVQTSMLQLVLVVLDSSTAVDGGRTLARDFGRLTWQLKDWAAETWTQKEQKGGQVDAGGRAAAGVLLRLDGVVSKTIGYR